MTNQAVMSYVREQFPALKNEFNGFPLAFSDGPGAYEVPMRVVEAMENYLDLTDLKRKLTSKTKIVTFNYALEPGSGTPLKSRIPPEQRNNIVAGLRTIALYEDELTDYSI